MKKIAFMFLFCAFSVNVGLSQAYLSTVSDYQPLRYGKNGAVELPQRCQVFDFSIDELAQKLLKNEHLTLSFNLFNQKKAYTFKMYATKAMPDDLADKYGIRTYSGQNQSNPSEMMSLTFSPVGVYGTVQSDQGNYYIEPDQKNRNYALVFAARDDPRNPQNEHICRLPHIRCPI
jgi:hypothetical protein